MKSFEDFIDYADKHAVELAKAAASGYDQSEIEASTLSKEDVILITKISQSNTVAILRTYHDWMAEET